MSDWFGGISAAVEGGLLSRALEPDSGSKPPHPDQPEQCRNCGTQLTGAYCHACGQKGGVSIAPSARSGTTCCTVHCISKASCGAPCPCWPYDRGS